MMCGPNYVGKFWCKHQEYDNRFGEAAAKRAGLEEAAEIVERIECGTSILTDVIANVIRKALKEVE